MSTQRILVVDDEVHIRRLLHGTLTRADYEVVEAINAAEALEQARRTKPDYVTKPFDSEEVLARLRASLRERVASQGAAPLVHSGAVQIDLANRRILRDGEEVHLTRKEFDVLTQLALHPGRVVTHQRILEAGWPHDHDRRIDYLRIVVRNLRQKLETDPTRPSMIVNELGIGYRLMAE